jgi:4-hydroxy-tetrahydrodipicolinate reductase
MTCFEANVPVVVGTTGWYKDFKMISERCNKEERTLLHATNFSVGVNLFFEINKRLAELMNPYPQYNVSIEEIHHTAKLDAPSGTAITLAEDIVNTLDLKKGWKNNKEVNDSEVLITSKRLPDVPGTHFVKYDSKIDTIEITHTAKSREGFALGAVLGAEFTIKRKGLFTMKDVLFCFE